MAIKESKKRKTRSKLRNRICLQISGIDEHIKAEFIDFSKANQLTYHETFNKVWRSFKFLPNTHDEIALIEEAEKITGESFKQLMTNAVMTAVKHIVAKERAKNIEPPQTVAANTRIANIVAEMIEQNAKAKYWYDRKYISQSSIAKYMERLKFQSESYVAVGVTIIKRYLEANKTLLDAHHTKYNLDEEHNRKAFNYIKVNSTKKSLSKDNSDNHDDDDAVHAQVSKTEKPINKSPQLEEGQKKAAKTKAPAKQKITKVLEREKEKAIKSKSKAQPESSLQTKITKPKDKENTLTIKGTQTLKPKAPIKQKIVEAPEHEEGKVLEPQIQPEIEGKQQDTARIIPHTRDRNGKLSKKARKLAKQARKAGRKLWQ